MAAKHTKKMRKIKSKSRKIFKGGEIPHVPGYKEKRIHDFYGSQHLSYLARLIVLQLKNKDTNVSKFYGKLKENKHTTFIAELEAFTIAYYTVDVDTDPEINENASVLSKLIINEEQINSDINKFFKTDMSGARPEEYGPKLIQLIESLYVIYV
jgi:hypothetical protein